MKGPKKRKSPRSRKQPACVITIDIEKDVIDFNPTFFMRHNQLLAVFREDHSSHDEASTSALALFSEEQIQRRIMPRSAPVILFDELNRNAIGLRPARSPFDNDLNKDYYPELGG